jgi:hypothetical protein
MDQVREAFLKEYKSDTMFEIVQILDRANDFGLTTEVVHTALKAMKEFPNSSPLLCLQIAAKDWDL